MEETGCAISTIIPICHHLVSPGESSESVFLYCGKVNASQAEGVYGLTDEHENIRVFSVSSQEALQMINEGRIINGLTIIALQWLAANRQRIRNEWSDK